MMVFKISVCFHSIETFIVLTQPGPSAKFSLVPPPPSPSEYWNYLFIFSFLSEGFVEGFDSLFQPWLFSVEFAVQTSLAPHFSTLYTSSPFSCYPQCPTHCCPLLYLLCCKVPTNTILQIRQKCTTFPITLEGDMSLCQDLNTSVGRDSWGPSRNIIVWLRWASGCFLECYHELSNSELTWTIWGHGFPAATYIAVLQR